MVVESLQPHELHEYHSLKLNTLKPTKTQFWVVKKNHNLKYISVYG